MTAGLPLDDDARAAALLRLGVLDEPPAPDLDGLTRLAISVTGWAVASVNLLDATRQWQASVAGAARESCSLADSLCVHTIAAGQTVHLPDLTTDLRFRHNPFVTGIRDSYRAYCAVPIRDVRGCAVGTLCVVDRYPRSLTEGQLAALQDLAAQVEHVFEMRRQHSQLLTVLAAADHLATHDTVTGLSNWRGLVDRAEHAIVRARRTQQFPTLVIGNLNAFSAVNEALGRDAGDAVLREVGERLGRTMRPADTVARLDGDEFGILCEDLVIGDRRIVAQRIRTAVAEPIALPAATAQVSISVGMVVARGEQGFDAVLREAKASMRADKATRRVSV